MSLNLDMVTSETIRIPYKGINASDPLIGMEDTYCLFSYNLISGTYGLKVRPGYDDWCTNVNGNAGNNTVKSILPFIGLTHTNLFAATDEGIYDVTSSSASPTKVVTFTSHSTSAGWMEWTHYVTVADHYLVCCDEANGYYHYSEANVWTKPTAGAGAGQINGVNPANLVFVMQWKERLWFIERDSTNAWYLPVGQITGTVTKFDFGNKFRKGGILVGLYSWTRDGGSGPDDYLVAISSAGDVLVYQGTDPSSTNSFALVGQWFAGNLPSGRRVAAKVGGDLWILSLFGIIPLSRLMSGEDATDKGSYVTERITPVMTSMMSTRTTSRGWEIRAVPLDGSMIIGAPLDTSGRYTQIVYGIDRDFWGLYRDIPYITGDAFLGSFYIGTADGRVVKLTGNTDRGKDILFAVMTSYKPTNKFTRVGLVRPFWISNSIPSYSASAKYDYDLNETYGAPSSSGVTSGGWDSGLWDSALWSGLQMQNNFSGSTGMGKAVAVAMNGSSNTDSTCIGFEILFDQGGVL